MPTITLPFPIESQADAPDRERLNELLQTLPPDLKEVAEGYPHLLEYLALLPIAQVGLPSYFPTLSRKMSDDKEPNIIYPVGGPVFAHVLVDFKDSRNNYITVEPTLTHNLDPLIHQIEEKCIEFGDRFAEFNADGDREQQLLKYIEQVTTLDTQTGSALLQRFPHPWRKNSNQATRVRLTQRELDESSYRFIRDKVGLGILDPLIADSYIEDISCSGLGQIFIEHKIFKSLKSALTFSSMEDLDHFVLRLAERVKKPVTYRNPIADATLPDGSRINVVYGRDVSKRGSNFSIRKFSEVPMSIFELVDFGTINYQMLAYLSLAIGNGMNVFVCGESASGKTTMLNALTTFIHPMAKVITLEDTPELNVPHENWIREVVQTTKTDDSSGAITMFELLKAALRQRPNAILIGEIRGAEGNIAFQAMQTGHAVMATFHAASMEKLIQRLTNSPISVPKTYLDNLNVIILMSAVKLPNGKMGRRITSINEITGFESSSESFNIVESFHWDEAVDRHEFLGYMTSYLLEDKIAPRIGIPHNKRQQIYAEVDKRAKILTRLHQDQKVTGFYEILTILGKAQREGLF